jgi:diguanylate cyclase (GGDEF)-like protein
MTGELRLDEKTGLYTEKMLEMLLAREIIRVRRYPRPLALMHFALRFKEQATQEILDSTNLVVANTLHATLREVDMPGHYQDNFLVVMPETDIDGVRKAGNRFLQQIQSRQSTLADALVPFGICAGITSQPGGPELTMAEMLSQAATALWEAQKRGPQNLVLYDEIVGSAA